MIPWYAKIAAKLVLARLPVDYRRWKKLGLFEHGHMEDPSYGEGVFLRHFDRSGLVGRQGFAFLEIGPGDSLFSALLGRAHGAGEVWLVDVGDFAARDPAAYRGMARHLAAKGLPVPPDAALASVEGMLDACRARYLVEGLASLRQIPSASLDLIWSQAVLEHIRRRDFDALLDECRRLLRPGAVMSHRIDLQDHLAHALNNLRFSERAWEAEWMARSGFYTNRLRFGDLIERFRRAGFVVEHVEPTRWAALPTPRRRLAAPFRDLPDEDLLVRGFDVVLRAR
jgi:SAM-dependent methyltransferase